MKAPKVPTPLHYSVDLDAIPVLLAVCQNLRDQPVGSLLADTGVRLLELASLQGQNLTARSPMGELVQRGVEMKLKCW